MTKKIITSFTILVISFSFIISNGIVSAINSFYSSNDVLFYDSSDNGCGNGLDSVGAATQTKSLEEFVDTYGQMAYDVGQKYGIPYEAILAQGVIESAYGRSELTTQAYNFFGIKASADWTGESINMKTGEVYSGSSVTVNADFRKYSSAESGWDDYGKFITQNRRYSNALDYPGDPIAYLTAIKTAGYATDPDYVNKVGSIANTIKKYISTTNKWQPSSIVTKKVTIDNTTDSATTTAAYLGCGELISGGMTLEKAQPFMNIYKNLTTDKWKTGTATEYDIDGTTCAESSLANCVAFSQYFINRYTTKKIINPGDGKSVVSNLLALGFTDGGHTPKAYAVFSQSATDAEHPWGHTGVVLGIDINNGTITIGEAACGEGLDWIKARSYSLSQFNAENYTYAYTDDFLKGSDL